MNYFLCMHADTKDIIHKNGCVDVHVAVAFNVFNDMYFHEIFC